MKPPDAALRQLVRQWLDKATADFEAAEQLCGQGGRFREIVAFHCQQAAEKYLKALLVQWQVEFPKTRDIAKLLDRVATRRLGNRRFSEVCGRAHAFRSGGPLPERRTRGPTKWRG